MSNGQKTRFEVAYMPWAGLTVELSVGPVTFWPFYEKCEEKIPDKHMLEYLQRFFGCFVDHHGKPVGSITVCTVGENDFRQYAENELSDVCAAVDCLAFASIVTGTKLAVCANNNSLAPPSADRFVLKCRRFHPDENDIAVSEGSSLTYYSDMSSIHFSKPWCLGGPFGDPSDAVLAGLSRILLPGFPSDTRERLLRSLEWYRLAHTESGSVTWLSKVVMMATAFEIFLGLPRNEKTRTFIERIEETIRTKDFLTDTRVYKEKHFPLSLVGCWATVSHF